MRELPWSLALGSIEDNLAGLEEEDEALADMTAFKVRELCKLRSQLVDALGLLREVHWSSISVEQAHGSSAVMHRRHTYAAEMLCARSFLHQCRHLWHPAPKDKQLDRLRARVAKLAEQQPEKMSGRHMFLRSLMADVKTRLAQGQKMSPHLRQTVMKEHSSLFRTLSPAEQASWQAESQQEISRKRKAQQDEIQHLADALQLARERAGLGVASSGHLTAEICARFTEQDWEAVLSLSKSPEFAHDVTALRRAAMTAPAAPPLQVQEALASIPVTAAAEAEKSNPDWLAPLCRNRELFPHTALVQSCEDGDMAFVFLYATQSPLEAFFVAAKLHRSALPSLAGKRGEEVLAGWDERSDFRLGIKLGQSVTHRVLCGLAAFSGHTGGAW